METHTGNFEQLPLAKSTIVVASAGHYRVYSDKKSFKLVEADSAVHALEASGLIQAFKIERQSLHGERLILPNFGAASVGGAAEQPTIN